MKPPTATPGLLHYVADALGTAAGQNAACHDADDKAAERGNQQDLPPGKRRGVAGQEIAAVTPGEPLETGNGQPEGNRRGARDGAEEHGQHGEQHPVVPNQATAQDQQSGEHRPPTPHAHVQNALYRRTLRVTC
jgi:hypothetical protein